MTESVRVINPEEERKVIDISALKENNRKLSYGLISPATEEVTDDITEDKNHIIIINTKDYEYYKDIFVSHIDSYLLHSEDKKEVKLYKKAIVKADKNYVYFILSKKAKDIEKTVNE